MIVKKILTDLNKLSTVSPGDCVSKALRTMEENNLMSIPVCEGSVFFGAVYKNDIYKKCLNESGNYEKVLEEVLVSEVVITDIPMLNSHDPIEKAIEFLEKRSLSFLPVKDDQGRFKGIVTHKAIFHEFTEVLGLNKGKRLSVFIYDIHGQISKLSKIITESGGDIISFVVLDPKVPIGVKEVVLRVNTDNFEELSRNVVNSGFNINL